MRKQQVEFDRPDGVRLVADAWGERGQPGIVFFHGGGQTRHAWKSSAQTLAQHGYYAMTVDLRGHGDSSWDATGRYRMADSVADVGAITESFLRPPIIVGASLGGILSMLYAGETPDARLRGLIMVDIVHRNDPVGIARIGEFMRKHTGGFANLQEAAAAVADYLPHREKPRDHRGLEKNLRRRADGRWYWHWDPRILKSVADSEIGDEARLLKAAQAVKAPLLLVRGLASDVVRDEHAQEFLRSVPNAREATVPRAAHMIAGDSNDRFTAAVLDFLGSLAAPQPAM